MWTMVILWGALVQTLSAAPGSVVLPLVRPSPASRAVVPTTSSSRVADVGAHIGRGTITAPIVPNVPSPPPSTDPIGGPEDLDRAFEDSWISNGRTARELAEPPVWLRRVWLDLSGTIPPPDIVTRFCARPDPAARAAVVDALLADPAFGRRFGRLLSRPLLMPGERGQEETGVALERFLSERLNAKASWAEIARALVSGEGGPGTGAFRAQFRETPHEIAGAIGKGLLGIRVRCAQCHDDTTYGWTVADYYGLASFYGTRRSMGVPRKLFEAYKAGKVRNLYELIMNIPEIVPRGTDHRWVKKEIQRYKGLIERWHKMGLGPKGAPQIDGIDWAAYDVYRLHRERRALLRPRSPGMFSQTTGIPLPGEEESLTLPSFVLTTPRPGQPTLKPGQKVPLRFPGDTRPVTSQGGRRQVLGRWLASPQNPYLAKAFVNRVFALLLGRGLVEPVDEIARSQDRSYEAILTRLAAGFTKAGTEVRWLVRTIVLSRSYGLGGILPSHLIQASRVGLAEDPRPAAPKPSRIEEDEETVESSPATTSPAPSLKPTASPTPTSSPIATFRFQEETAVCARNTEEDPSANAFMGSRPFLQAAVRPLGADQIVASLGQVCGRSGQAPPAELTREIVDLLEMTTDAQPAFADMGTLAPEEPASRAVPVPQPTDAPSPNTNTPALSQEARQALAPSIEESSVGTEEPIIGAFPPGPFLAGPELIAFVQQAPILESLRPIENSRDRLTRLFQQVLSRSPTPTESARFLTGLRAPGPISFTPAVANAWSDVLWALVSSAEFLTNH